MWLSVDEVSKQPVVAEENYSTVNENIIGEINDMSISMDEIEEEVQNIQKNAIVKSENTKEIKSYSPSKNMNSENQSNKTNIVKNETLESSIGSKYYVMAGSYLLEENAKKMVVKLNSLGYDNAEVVVLGNSQYHSVIANRYVDENKARSTVGILKQKGIESYVKVVKN